ncbi:MAG: DUF5684 domain-containing protein [Candidatus Neomarinimicrobiota bacterium]
MKFLIILIFTSRIMFAQEIVKRYWNSLSTHVTIGVPLVDDETLIGGRIQIRAGFNQDDTFSDFGNPFIIEKSDIDDIKQISIGADTFENMDGFQEDGEVQFIAQIWDRAGNSIIGSVSDSVLTVDQTLPDVLSFEIISSNELDSTKAMPGDSITFQINTTESINVPIFNINNESFDGAVGLEKSWMLVYPSDEADDGMIQFEVSYSDIAGNPGIPISVATNGISITKDGTLPELDSISLFSSNVYDSSLAIKDDTVFINFKSTELIRDVKVLLNSNEAKLQKNDSLSYTYFHVFTESDSEGVIPIVLDYRDLSGNIGETIDETSNDSEVTLDMNPPAEFKIEDIGTLQGEIVIDLNEESDNLEAKSKQNKKEFGLLFIIILSILGLTFLLYIISWVKIFSKAGQAGWKVLIPFFNIFIFTKIVDKPIWWLVIYLILPFGYIFSALHIAQAFGKNLVYSIGLIFLPMVFYPMLAFGKSEYSND